jgi:hypothetical protein
MCYSIKKSGVFWHQLPVQAESRPWGPRVEPAWNGTQRLPLYRLAAQASR